MQNDPIFQVLKGTALSVLVLWTIAANTLVFIVLYKNPRLQTVPNLLVGNLAFSDLCLGLIVLPLSSIYAIAGEWLFPETLCIIFVSADILCSTASIWNLSIVGLDRYWAITTPVAYMSKRNKRTACVMILSVWVSSMLISLAPLLGWKQVAEHGNLVKINGTWQCTFLDLPSYTIYSATGSFFIPTIVMFFVYFKIYQAFAKHRARQIYRQKVIRKHIESTILHEISHVLPTSDEFAKDDEEEDDSDENNDKFGAKRRKMITEDEEEDVENDLESNSGSESAYSSSSGDSNDGPGRNTETKSADDSFERRNSSRQRSSSSRRCDFSSRKRRKSKKSQEEDVSEFANGFGNSSTCETSLVSNSVIVRRQTSPPPAATTYMREAETTISSISESTSRPSSIITSGDVDAPAQVTRPPVSRIASTPAKGTYCAGSRYHNPQYYHSQHAKPSGRHGDPERVPTAISYEKVKRHKRRKERAYRRSLQRKPKAISAAKERRGVKVLGIILGCFTICWTPFFVMYVLSQFCARCAMNKHIEMFITWLGYSNSAMNPIIYTVFNRDYQIALKRLFVPNTSKTAISTTLHNNNNNNKNVNINVNRLINEGNNVKSKRELLMAAGRAISSPPQVYATRSPLAERGVLATVRQNR